MAERVSCVRWCSYTAVRTAGAACAVSVDVADQANQLKGRTLDATQLPPVDPKAKVTVTDREMAVSGKLQPF